MISVAATNLVKGDSIAEQIGFFENSNEEKRKKSKKREMAVDNIRQKYGGASITKASFIDTDLGISPSKDKNGNG